MLVFALWLFILIGLVFGWAPEIGYPRAILATVLRALWTLPVLLSLFPVTVSKRIPGSVAMQPIHILLDDSDSMSNDDALGESAKKQATSMLKRVDDVCAQFGCIPKISRLSDLSADTRIGFTPLSRVLEPWLYKTAGDPWLLLSDGGDFRPTSAWDEGLRGRGLNLNNHQSGSSKSSPGGEKSLGLVVAFGRPRDPGFSVENINMSPLAFEGKSVQLEVTVARLKSEIQRVDRVQIQILLDGKVVTASEAVFSPGGPTANVEISFAAPRRGPHLIAARVLPVAGELDTWDNSQTRVLDVVPNTVGVLHLLGSPAWDGRFMRRFLKAEPKFDVISFFILRDPWDSQQVSEREMSLIPFPVERLFKEELVNFRVIVMQNFTLMRFLQPEFQQNLAKFVTDGGGLLFVGGPRALSEADVSSSALSGLLPFSIDRNQQQNKTQEASEDDFNDGFASMGSTWLADQKFSVVPANPEASRRALANIYENWFGMSDRLAAVNNMSGIHDMSLFRFRDKEITPLLEAKLVNGQSVPLAMASYPGKGRALWLFTDSIWNLAMSPNPRIARSDYHEFMESALRWLTKGDMRGALSVRDFKVNPLGDRSDRLGWRAVLSGSGSKFLRSSNSMRVSVCGVGVPFKELNFGGAAGETITMQGEIFASLRDGSLCSIKLDAEHPAFGSLSVTGWSTIPETLPDAKIGASPMKLKALSSLTGARFVEASDERARAVESWIQAWGAFDGRILPDKSETRLDYYWPQNSLWIWIAVLMLPVEVLIRRWHLIFGGWSEKKRRGDL